MNDAETATAKLSELLKQASPEPDAKAIERVHAAVDRRINLSLTQGQPGVRRGIRRVFSPVIVTCVGVAVIVFLVLLVVGRPFDDRSSRKELAPAMPTCTSRPDASLQLGGAGSAMKGNPVPVQSTLSQGDLLLVTARLGTRKMSYPHSATASLSEICHQQSGNDYGTLFVAKKAGPATVESHTADCLPCAQLSFAAKVAVLG
jgi:hypothetical protein